MLEQCGFTRNRAAGSNLVHDDLVVRLVLENVVERLKAEKLTFRNVPRESAPADGTCIFSGEPAVERILVARAY